MFGLNNLIEQEDAIGVIEMVLVLVVIVGLVVIFKKQLNSLIKQIFGEVCDRTVELY